MQIIDKLNKINENKWFNFIMLPAGLFWIYSFLSKVVPVLWYSDVPGILTILVLIIVVNEFISTFNYSLLKYLEKR